MGAEVWRAGLLVALALVGGGAEALSLADAARPLEPPPEAYAGAVYVDSRGCIYVRAEIGTTVNWVPRMTRDRRSVVCGMRSKAAIAALSAPEPAPLTPQVESAGGAPIIRQMDVDCPPMGTTARVRVGQATVTVHCPPGMAHSSAALVTHADGSQTRLLTHPTRAGGQAQTSAEIAQTGPDQAPAQPAPWVQSWLTSDNRLRTPLGDITLAPAVNVTSAPVKAVTEVTPEGIGQ